MAKIRNSARKGQRGISSIVIEQRQGCCVYPQSGYTASVKVELSRLARKQLTRVPGHIVRKFALWVDLVQVEGLDAARAIPGFADHALKGDWKGYYAIRLSDAYRAIYIIRKGAVVETAFVEEVNKHDY